MVHATHSPSTRSAGYTLRPERLTERQTDEKRTRACARLSSGRPYEAILFERPGEGGLAILTALIDRRTGALSLVAEADGLGRVEADELRELALSHGDGAAPLAKVDLRVARLRLARAILATRIGGGEVPAWLAEHAELVGDPAHPSSRVDDVYLCFACDRPLPIAEQLARAAQLGPLDCPPRCPACRGEASSELAEGEVWLGRGWLMIAAGLPRRALVCAARAEGARLPPARLDGLRGAALLALGDERSAVGHLERAREADPEDARIAGWHESLRGTAVA